MRLRHKMVRIARNLPLAAGQLSLSIAPVGRPYKERPNKGKSLGRECERVRARSRPMGTACAQQCRLVVRSFLAGLSGPKKSRPQRPPAFV